MHYKVYSTAYELTIKTDQLLGNPQKRHKMCSLRPLTNPLMFSAVFCFVWDVRVFVFSFLVGTFPVNVPTSAPSVQAGLVLAAFQQAIAIFLIFWAAAASRH